MELHGFVCETGESTCARHVPVESGAWLCSHMLSPSLMERDVFKASIYDLVMSPNSHRRTALRHRKISPRLASKLHPL